VLRDENFDMPVEWERVSEIDRVRFTIRPAMRWKDAESPVCPLPAPFFAVEPFAKSSFSHPLTASHHNRTPYKYELKSLARPVIRGQSHLSPAEQADSLVVVEWIINTDAGNLQSGWCATNDLYERRTLRTAMCYTLDVYQSFGQPVAGSVMSRGASPS
jgi:hypothetical protein